MALKVAKTCILKGRFTANLTLLSITTAIKTTIETVKMKILALASFFCKDGANII
jgi:hypothetical protein